MRNVLSMTVVLFAVIAAAAAAQSAPAGPQAGMGQTAATENAARQSALAWYTGLSAIRGRTADTAAAIFQARVALGYSPGDSAVASALAAKRPLLSNLILSYLSSRTAEELAGPRESEVEQALLSRINRIMGSETVRAVRLTSLDLASQ
jgi:flagellar basal body-associated protein FliL